MAPAPAGLLLSHKYRYMFISFKDPRFARRSFAMSQFLSDDEIKTINAFSTIWQKNYD